MKRTIRVRRRLLHWRPRWRGPRFDSGSGVDGEIDGGPGGAGGGGGGLSFLDVLDDIFAAVLVIVAVVVFVTTVVPALVLLLEVLLVGLLAALGLVGRALLGRPWTVAAVDTETHRVVGSWQVEGFRRAGEVAAAIQARADAGQPLPPPEDATTVLAGDADEPTWPTS